MNSKVHLKKPHSRIYGKYIHSFVSFNCNSTYYDLTQESPNSSFAGFLIFCV